MKATLFNIQKFSIHDGPGIRTVLFFKGCHLRCPWCSNPESQSRAVEWAVDARKCTNCGDCIQSCPHQAIASEEGRLRYDATRCVQCNTCVSVCLNDALTMYGKPYSIDEMLQEVEKDRAFYARSGGGVTLSGGEAFLQAEVVRALCDRLRQAAIHIAVETSLAFTPEQLEPFVSRIDTWLIDLKHHDADAYRTTVGADLDEILTNLKKLQERQAEVTVRIPVIPGFNSSESDAQAFARLLNDYSIRHVDLLPFHSYGEAKYDLLDRPYAFSNVPRLTDDELTRFAAHFKQQGMTTQIGG